ncbi:MAG TPA: S49 family peptidase, partial [Acidimicrobiales bacterium]|nr:S49 family peptidase [Acidimicrobiales bacterium]
MNKPSARFVKPGEMLAIDTSAIRSGPEGFFWLFGGGVAANERREDVAIVHVRGALDHHADSWEDNYESILQRVRDAMSGADTLSAHKRKQAEHEWRHRYEDGYQPLADIEAKPPAAVILCIDSPGGVVSGLNETVYAIQKMREETGVPLVAYVNEMAASAAYALCCACSQVVAPPSAIVGSIGVISTMISQAERNKREGFDVRLITSGARKSDGHLHAPITDEAEAAERSRVNKLAATFFRIASKARKIPVATIEGFQAAIYLGKDAERRKLVDEVASLDDVVLALSKASADGAETAGGNETDRRAAHDSL